MIEEDTLYMRKYNMENRLNTLLVLVLLFNNISNSYSGETNNNQLFSINTQNNISFNSTEIKNNNIVIENSNGINSDSEDDMESKLDIPINKIKLFKDNHNNFIKKLKNASNRYKKNYKNIKLKINSTITELNDIADSIFFNHNNITSELHNYINHLIKLRENFILPTGRSYSRNTKLYKLEKTIKDCIYESNKTLLQIISINKNDDIQSDNDSIYINNTLHKELSPIEIFQYNHNYTLNILQNIINNSNYSSDINNIIQSAIKQLMYMMGKVTKNSKLSIHDDDNWKIIAQRKEYVRVLHELKENMGKYGIIENDIINDIINNALITTKIIIHIIIPD